MDGRAGMQTLWLLKRSAEEREGGQMSPRPVRRHFASTTKEKRKGGGDEEHAVESRTYIR